MRSDLPNQWNLIHKQNNISDFGVMRRNSSASVRYSFQKPPKQQPIEPKESKSPISRTNISKIPSNNKNLVFGYIRQSYSGIIPQLIKYLCLLFWNETIDKWDYKNKHKSIIINNNTIKRMTGHGYKSCYLSKIVHSGQHIWTFKFGNNSSWLSTIGIHKCNTKLTVSYAVNQYRLKGIGLILFSWNAQTKSKLCKRHDGTIYAIECSPVKILKMKVDFNTLTLSYSIDSFNKGAYFKANNIKKTEYRAGVTLAGKNNEISLILYQHIY
eukprot:238069_1